MTLKIVPGRGRAHFARATMMMLGLTSAAVFATAPVVHAQPAIGSVTSSAPAAGVPRYGKLELTFSVNTSATNDFLPYDPVAPSYAANLRPNEDARNGISVDALLLPPGQTDWSKAQVWPCYWQEDVDVSSNVTPEGTSGWRLRFAPTATGTWAYELRATDASGTVTTAPATFSCVPSNSKGFLHVSQTDTRYFEYGDGTPFIAAGANDAGSLVPTMAAMGAAGLHRVWLGTEDGFGLYGGFWEIRAAHCFLGNDSCLTTDSDAHSGRFSWKIAGGTAVMPPSVPGQTYQVSFWVKGVGNSPGDTLSVPANNGESLGVSVPLTQPAGGSLQNGWSLGPADAHGWQHVIGAWTPAIADPNTHLPVISIQNPSAGYALLDDMTINNASGGDILGGCGDFEWQTDIDQVVAAQIDSMVAQADAAGNQYFKFVCNSKLNFSPSAIDTNGGSCTDLGNPDRALGGSPDPKADTPVQRFQRYYARYLMARWGYSTSVHSFEYTNEMDYNHNLQWAGAEAFGAAIHSYTAEGRRAVTSSSCFNGSGVTYQPAFYESAAYSDIDYADFHGYAVLWPTPYADLPYGDVPNAYNVRGSMRVPSGGPSGHGQLQFSLATQAPGDPYNLAAILYLPTLHGQGQWTIKAFYRTSPNAKTNSPSVAVSMPGIGYAIDWMPSGPVANWTEYTGTFSVPDDQGYGGATLRLYGTLDQGTPAGSYCAFSDVRLIAPDGKTFYRITFDEPSMEKDSASIVQYMPGGKQSYSGDPAINKPFVLGECDDEIGDASGNASGDPALASDTAANFDRQAFWGGLLSTGALTPVFWGDAVVQTTGHNGWRYLAGVQKFLQGVPLSNGRYRDLDATASPTLRVIGQKDTQAGQAVLWVQNHGSAGDGSDAANWKNLAVNPGVCAPVSGSVAIPGLPAGTYEADVWDPATATVVNSLFLTTTGGVLTVPVTNLAIDEAVKVAPASVPNLTLQLTASKTTASPGDTVTFTLTYTNTGSMPALGVSLPWAVPDHTSFVSASSGGAYDAGQNTVTWRIGTVSPGGSGSVTLTTLVK